MARNKSSSSGRSSSRSLFAGNSSSQSKSIIPVSRSVNTAPVKKSPTTPALQSSPSMFSTFASSAAGAIAGNALSGMFHRNEDEPTVTQDNLSSFEPNAVAPPPDMNHHPCASLINQFIFCAESSNQHNCSNQWSSFEQCHRQNPSWF